MATRQTRENILREINRNVRESNRNREEHEKKVPDSIALER